MPYILIIRPIKKNVAQIKHASSTVLFWHMYMQKSVVHEHESCSGLKVWHSWRLLVFFPMDQTGSGLKGATNKPHLHYKASEGGVVCGGGKSTDVHLSFCPLLLSPFPVFNLVNTCCSYNMPLGHPPTPPILLLASSPQSLCLLVEAASALSSLIAPQLPSQQLSSSSH